jgi:hypothetical protein
VKLAGLKSRREPHEVVRWIQRYHGKTTLLQLPRIARRRFTRSEQNSLTIMGVIGSLAKALNKYPELRQSYENDKWLGIIDQLALMVNRERLESVLAIHLAHECSWFWHLGWRIDCCAYGSHRKGYWYVRQPIGRPPEACPMHARAARQHRWENALNRKRRN